MSTAVDTGQYRRIELPGGIMDDEELEERVADVIDELWERYAHEEWLTALVEEDRGGEVLEKIARRVVDGEHPDVVVFAMQCGVTVDAS